MTGVTVLKCPAAGPVLATVEQSCDVLIADEARIPGSVQDLATFRQWMHSNEFPQRGLIAYLQDCIWVDMSPEELFTHNRVRAAFTAAIGGLLQQTELGEFAGSYVRWSNINAGVSTEPDGMFYTWDMLRSGRLKYVEGLHGGIMELEGALDMALEIVSATSVNKDTVRLRDLYWRAGVTEYWLVDVRANALKFEILRHTPTGYVAVTAQDGWLTSAVFGRAFQLTRRNDPEGNPKYKLESREANQA
ncbi:MAG TPA: Uma2 family endonuclease [Gemmataceae bacterium]|nr:Uma2 family endonuclease [Gemmataceae bacterium]